MQEISEEIFRFYLNKIDISKLKRDYQKFPLKKIGRKREIPFKEDLEYLFLELNFPARKNHLNLLEFFSFRDFENWINERG